MAKRELIKKSGYPTKRERIVLHKYTVLCQCLMETLDEMNRDSPIFRESLEEAERILDIALKNSKDPIKTTMYLEEIAQKIDTIMRKNYKPM